MWARARASFARITCGDPAIRRGRPGTVIRAPLHRLQRVGHIDDDHAVRHTRLAHADELLALHREIGERDALRVDAGARELRMGRDGGVDGLGAPRRHPEMPDLKIALRGFVRRASARTHRHHFLDGHGWSRHDCRWTARRPTARAADSVWLHARFSARYASRSNRGVCFYRARDQSGRFFRVYEPSRIFESPTAHSCHCNRSSRARSIKPHFRGEPTKRKQECSASEVRPDEKKFGRIQSARSLPPSGRASVAMAGSVPPHAVFLYGVAVGAALAANALRRRMRRRLRALNRQAPRVRVGLEVRACG